MESYFVNVAFDSAIKNYLESKNNKDGIMYNSFLVMTIRKLIHIYGELDIIAPYNSKNENLLRENILKHRFSKMKLNKFFSDLELYYENEKNGIIPNNIFVSVEMFLIDMYMTKKINFDITIEDQEVFKNMLYTENASNPLVISFNYLNAIDNKAIAKYYEKQDKLNIKVEISEPKVLLAPEAYRVIDENYTNICLLTPDEVNKINEEVYKKLNVNKEEVNFDHLYDVALFNYYNEERKITSGNGYVDILLVMGIIATFIMTILIVGFIILY